MLRFFCVICLSLILFSCNDPLKEVDVGITPFWGEAAFYIAKSNDFFEEQGLEVISHPNLAGKESLRELYESNLDIAHVAAIPMAYALSGSKKYPNADDMPVKIFTGMIYTTNSQNLIARTDHGINSPEDLENKKIGVHKGTTSEFFLDNFLIEHNIDANTIERVNIDVSAHFEALKNGDVDAIATWEPHASQILEGLQDKATRLNTMLDHSTLWLAVASDSYINQNSETITAYLKALKKAQDYIKKHPSEAQELVARKTNTSKQIIEKLWNSIEYELSMGERMLILLDDQQRWLREKSYIEGRSSSSSVNIKEAIYFNALEEVYPEGLTIIR